MLSRIPFGQAARNLVYSTYKFNAKKRGLSFRLSVEEFESIATRPCFYCGDLNTKIKESRAGNGDFVYNGIDRVNNNLGYFPKNCVSCCKFCNGAKSSYSKTKFLLKIEKIYNNHFRLKNLRADE